MEDHYNKIHRAHEMGLMSTAETAEFLETDSDGRERMLAQLVDNLLTETMVLNDRIREHRELVADLLHSDDLQSIAPSPVLMALVERIRIRFRIDSNVSQ